MASSLSRNLLVYYAGAASAGLGANIYMVAISIVLARTSPLALSVVWLVRMGSLLSARVLIGSLTDRLSTKTSLVVSGVGRALLFIWLPGTFHTVWLYILIFAIGLLQMLSSSAHGPLVTRITQEANRQRVNAIENAIQSALSLLAPLAAGFLVVYDLAVPFYIQALSLLFWSAAVGRLRLDPLPADMRNLQSPQERPSLRASLRALKGDLHMAWQSIRRTPVLLAMTLVMSIIALEAPIEVNEALFILRAVHLGAAGYAIFVTFQSLAMLCGDVMSVWIGSRIPAPRLYAVAISMIAVGDLLFVSAHGLVVLCASALLLGVATSALWSAMSTVEQTCIPVQEQGRVQNAMRLTPDMLSALAVIIAGACLLHFPMRDVMVAFALLTLPAIWLAWRVAVAPPLPVIHEATS